MPNELKTFLEDTDPIYRAMDSFLTEFTDIEGKPIFRSIDRLNKDRRLFVEEMKKRDQRLIQKVVEIMGKKVREITPYHMMREYRDTDKMADEMYKLLGELKKLT